MPNNKWDDEHIENLLKGFPAIRDERPKEEVYNRLAKTDAPRKQVRRMTPILIAALALITFAVLLASVLNQGASDTANYEMSSTEESADDSAAVQDSSGAEQPEAELRQDAATEESGEFSMMETETQDGASVYAEDLEGFALFTMGLTENAFVIPVSFLIPEEQISEDFGNKFPSAAQLYNQYAGLIDEQALGFDDYHPYSGTIEDSNEGVAHILPDSHPYDMASAATEVYTGTILETFKNAGQVEFLDEEGGTAEFGQIGPMEALETENTNTAYYAYTTGSGETYLVPGYNMPHASAAEALEAMKSAPDDFRESVIPSEVGFTVDETAGTVNIDFTEPFRIGNYGESAVLRMIEGMALTAEAFGKNIRFNGIEEEQWNRFDFTQPVAAPEAVNRQTWMEN